MTLPQRTFFTVQEVTIRWDCSPYDLAGWAIAGKLDIVAAIEPIGAILAAHFPKTETDVNELPNRLIQL